MLPGIEFYYIAVPAVILVGMAKGGMGEALSLMGVPLLAMAISPVQAAAILLPILIAMDIVSLWIWRKHSDKTTLLMLLPGGIAGIAIGWATAALVNREALRLIIGLITVGFVLRYLYNVWRSRRGITVPPKPQRLMPALFWGGAAGYGSFVAHAGGPPFQIYALPLQLPPREYTGTIIRFFAILNVVKLVPYFALGSLGTSNLTTSLSLFPFAIVSTIIGAWIIRRIKPDVFYPFMYTMAFLAGCKLLWDGISAFLLA
ncbi:sulfite exporter TauE/SafE family protein [Pararhizobium sp.]|uniref:sulfite exporter TauE/SafE family protein n=1 Tax=Pararhizobium sp. TaxID=1977563 RepID=UPI00271C004A|nr:sulfite exporter TauE/SafE family protein [Pararhizobium sp.]MDO9415157.1 sulfite exporter TauE/SafE family protein [Pararhizobium sp.]